MRIQETVVTDKQIALELHSENGKFRLPIDGQDHYFPNLKKVHEAFLNQDTYDTIKLTHNGKKSYLHLFMDEIEVFDTKKALRQRLSQDSQGMWAEIRKGKTHYYIEQRGWTSTTYKEITEQECIEKLEHTSTMTKVLGIGLGILALLPGAIEFARRLPIGTKEAAMGLIVLNQKSPVLGAVGYSLLPTKVDAQAAGTEFQINTYTTSDQSYPSIAPLNDGGFVVTWQSNGQDGSGLGVFGQRYDSDGVAAGGEFQVNTYTTGYQSYPSMAPLNDGGFVVTWSSEGQDGDVSGIYGKRFDSNGVAAGPEFRVNTYTTSTQQSPSIAPLSDGGFVVTWISNGQDGDSYGIYGQRYDSSGVVTGTEFQVNTYTTSAQNSPSIAPLNDGGFVVTWSSDGQDGNSYGIYGQRYGSNGAAMGAEFQINTYTINIQQYSSVAPLNDGGFIVIWQSNGQDGDLNGIFGQRYDSNGGAIGSEFQVNTYTTRDQSSPSVAPLNDGGFVVIWQSDSQDGNLNGIFGQRYDTSGVAAGPEFQVNSYTSSHQESPSIAPLNDGGFVVTWQSASQDGNLNGIFGQRYDAVGNPITLQLPIVTLTPTPALPTPTPTFVTTQSSLSSPTIAPPPTFSVTPSPQTSFPATPSNSPSPTPVTTSSTQTSSPSQIPIDSPATPSSTPSPTPVTTSSTLRSPTLFSTTSSASTQSVFLTESSSRAPSTSPPIGVTSSTLEGVPVEKIVYEANYPILINDEVVGTYTISGGSGLLDIGNLNVLTFEFDPSFQPEEGEIITLFEFAQEDVAIFESIQIESETIECLEPHGYVDTKLEGSTYQIIFEETTCLAIAPTLLANTLPLTLN